MKLSLSTLNEKEFWQSADIAVPAYDVSAMVARTKAAPAWVHFGAGNIFRGYIAKLQNNLLNAGLADTGIVAVDSSDGYQLEKVYRPFDNLTMLVSLYADGSSKKEIVASIAEAVHADWNKPDQLARLKEIFTSPSLQMCSFTITEKGYAIRSADGSFLPAVAADLENGPGSLKNVMSKVTALLHERFLAGGSPIAVVSMDNCSHNGEKLKASILAIAEAWQEKGFVSPGFLGWLNDEEQVSFPWSMIDKITPRPNAGIASMLEKLGVEDMQIIPREKGAPVAPFVNCESSEYLVIEDRFPNGRPALEKAGVYMTDRETVNKTERMKVTTCLNPLHTALAVNGCMLGYDRIFKEMQDDDLRALVEKIGSVEGMPVVTNPGILNPEDFLQEVLTQRLPNPYIPDTPQRIACDTSQKIPVRFGETIKSYLASDTLDIASLDAIPFVLASWLRYLLALDDQLQPMQPADDPRLAELQDKLTGITVGDPSSCKGRLSAVLSDETIFGTDLTATPLAAKVEAYLAAMLEGSGAVRRTLHNVVTRPFPNRNRTEKAAETEAELSWGSRMPDDLLERWPKNADGETEKPVFLCNCRSQDMGDELKINMLEAYGIPCLRIYPHDGSFGRVVLGMSGFGTDIYVPESMLEDAKALCNPVSDEDITPEA